MLRITVPLSESFDEATSKFIIEGYDLELEHSLSSLSKWESKFEKPFLGPEEKTTEETLFYMHSCVVVTENPPAEIFQKFSKDNYAEIQKYINAKRSATWFSDREKRSGARQIVTSAVIYGWMVALRIPFETQHWHLHELFTLIKVVSAQNAPPKKMSRADAARQQSALNAKRRAEMGTRG